MYIERKTKNITVNQYEDVKNFVNFINQNFKKYDNYTYLYIILIFYYIYN